MSARTTDQFTAGATVRLRIDLAYDGGGFAGFARQRDVRTVQGVLEDRLRRMVGVDIPTTCAGRTDAGVHALGQVVTCDVPADWRLLNDLARATRGLDRSCGPEITIWSLSRVGDNFDARFSARRRRYCYRLCDSDAMAPLARHDTWHVGPPRLDVTAMRCGARALVGEHDFSSFCRRSGDQHLVRRVERLDVERGDDAVLVSVEGPAFCHQMVRSMVACLVRVGRGRLGVDQVPAVLAARDRAAVGAIAPPHGLTLVGVDYDGW